MQDPLLALRNSLTYGKLVVARSTTAYEYYVAHFSAPMPLDWLPLSVSPDGEACAAGAGTEAGKMLLAMRGNCSFLDKSRNASHAKAAALIVVNNDTDLFQIAAGYALGNSSLDDGSPHDLPTIMVKRHAMLALQWGVSNYSSRGRMVPLRCPSGDTTCTPILPEEAEIDLEIDSGFLDVGSKRIEFLSGTWGGILPEGNRFVFSTNARVLAIFSSIGFVLSVLLAGM